MKFFHHKDLGNHLLQLWPKVVKHPVYKIFKYIIIIIIIIDIFNLIRKIRNLSALSISHYPVNTLFATFTPVFLNISVNVISSILLLDEATVLTNLLVNTFPIIFKFIH